MKKYNIFNYLCEYQEADDELDENLTCKDYTSHLLTEDELRILRTPDHDKAAKIIAMIKSRIN